MFLPTQTKSSYWRTDGERVGSRNLLASNQIYQDIILSRKAIVMARIANYNRPKDTGRTLKQMFGYLGLHKW